MKFQINSEVLKKAIGFIKNTSPAKPQRDVFGSIKITASKDGVVQFRSTDGNTESSYKVKGDVKTAGNVVVNNFILSQVGYLQDGLVDVSSTKNKFNLKQGKRSYSAPLFAEPEQFPAEIEINEFIEINQEFLNLMNLASLVCEDMSYQVSSCIHVNLKDGKIVANYADNSRAMVIDYKLENQDSIFNLNANVFNMFYSYFSQASEQAKIELHADNTICIRVTDGEEEMQFITQANLMEFPTLAYYFEDNYGHEDQNFKDCFTKIIVDAIELRDAFKPCLNYSRLAKSEGQPGYVDLIANGDVTFQMEIKNHSDLTEPLECKLSGEAATFRFDLSVISEVISKLKGNLFVYLKNEKSAIILKSELIPNMIFVQGKHTYE